MNNADRFDAIVGQPIAKRKLNFWLDAYDRNHWMPNLLFIGPKGNGKTMLAKETAKNLTDFDENGRPVTFPDSNKHKWKPSFTVNCSTVKSVKAFFTGVIQQVVHDKNVSLILDEAHELPKDVTAALLTVLNPNPTNRNSFIFDEMTYEFDFKRQTFLFCTSESHKLFPPLMDRLERVDLEDYSLFQLGQIIQRGAKDVQFEDGLLEDIASVLRGNGRGAQKMANNILLYLQNSKTFMRAEWEKMKKTFGILPLGLSPIELSVLNFLQESPEGLSLTSLSAKTGMSRVSLQHDVELFLQKMGLMVIETGGRKITGKGLAYLIDKKKSSIPLG